MSEQINFTFRIKQIATLEFSIKNIPEGISINPDIFKFGINPQLFIESDEKVIGFNTIINVIAEEASPNLICTLATRISFEIINFQDFVIPEDPNSLNLPDTFIQTLLSISLSTSRGILTAKTEGTVLKDVYMPVLNPAGFKPKPSEISQT
jgi:hypothetical protein